MSDPLQILVLCPHYRPDSAPTGDVMTTLVEQWINRGHRVDVVTSLPWYKDHAVAEGWSGRLVRTEHGPQGQVRRWYPFPTDKGNLVARAAAFVGFTGLVGIDAAWSASGYDVVFAMSPPLTLGVAGWAAARRARAPLVFNVQDIFPDAAIETGVLRGSRAIALARQLERWVYRRSDRVTTLSEDLAANIRAKLGPSDDPAKVVVIPNMADVSRINPGERHNQYRAELGLSASVRSVVMYAGNLGHSQSLHLVVAAAEQFRAQGRTDVQFVVNGDGVARSELAEAAERLNNLTLVGWQPPERLGEVLGAADLHLVLLRRGLGQISVPSKVYAVMASSRPVLASVDQNTEVERLLAVSGAGQTVDPDDSPAFCAALTEMLADPDRLAEMGARGRAYVEQSVNPQTVANQYLDLFQQLTNN